MLLFILLNITPRSIFNTTHPSICPSRLNPLPPPQPNVFKWMMGLGGGVGSGGEGGSGGGGGLDSDGEVQWGEGANVRGLKGS